MSEVNISLFINLYHFVLKHSVNTLKKHKRHINDRNTVLRRSYSKNSVSKHIPPGFSENPSFQLTNTEGETTLSCIVVGDYPTSLQWLKNDNIVSQVFHPPFLKHHVSLFKIFIPFSKSPQYEVVLNVDVLT